MPPGPVTPTTLPLKSLTRDALGTDQCVIHVRLHAADDRERRPLRDRAHRRHAGDDRIVDVPADQGGDGRWPAANKNCFDFQAFGGEEAKSTPTISGNVLFKVGV